MPARTKGNEVKVRHWTLGDVPARMLVSKGVDCDIPHRLERGLNEDVYPNRVDCDILYRLERKRSILYKSVETSP